jgi:hypothetical protein
MLRNFAPEIGPSVAAPELKFTASPAIPAVVQISFCSLRVKLYSINLGAMYRICSSDAERGCSIVAGHWNAAGIYCLQAIETVVGQVGSIRPMHSAVAANQRRQEPLYSARVSLDAMQMQIDDKMVNPGLGMAVTVESKIVTRRLIEYLMSSQFRFRHESLRER